MRYSAYVKNKHPGVKRVLLHVTPNNWTYLFPCESEEDGSARGDYYFETLDLAMEVAEEDYGIQKTDWQEYPDPLPNCMQDWLIPARHQGQDIGVPQYGRENLELWLNDQWVPISEVTALPIVPDPRGSESKP